MVARSRPRQALRKGAYLLPSLFTVGNILLGFYALILGLRGEFRTAVWLLLIAAILDNLDGRVARLAGSESDFGREYDSLADVMTFGMVPAMLAFSHSLEGLGRIGWMIPAFYVVCAATRLARFNVQTGIIDKRSFVGLPVPAGAGLIGSLLFVWEDGGTSSWYPYLVLGAHVYLGLMMVSTFRFPSFKELDPRRSWSFRIVLVIALVFLFAAYEPGFFFLTFSGSYALAGPTSWLMQRIRGTRRTAPLTAETATPDRNVRS